MGRKSLKSIRQKEIIEVFYRVAKKEGLENASLAKTAAIMNINPSLIMHYFKTREALTFGLVDYILDKYLHIFRTKIKEDSNPKALLLAVIENIFSKKWNTLFDDGVSYSCYSLTFRDKKIRKKYKLVLDALRLALEEIIIKCKEKDILHVDNPRYIADIIFVLVDGAYYYLSLIDDKKEYEKKLSLYKQRAMNLLQLE